MLRSSRSMRLRSSASVVPDRSVPSFWIRSSRLLKSPPSRALGLHPGPPAARCCKWYLRRTSVVPPIGERRYDGGTTEVRRRYDGGTREVPWRGHGLRLLPGTTRPCRTLFRFLYRGFCPLQAVVPNLSWLSGVVDRGVCDDLWIPAAGPVLPHAPLAMH